MITDLRSFVMATAILLAGASSSGASQISDEAMVNHLVLAEFALVDCGHQPASSETLANVLILKSREIGWSVTRESVDRLQTMRRQASWNKRELCISAIRYYRSLPRQLGL